MSFFFSNSSQPIAAVATVNAPSSDEKKPALPAENGSGKSPIVEVEALKSTSVALVPSTSALRAMGRRTPSQRSGKGKLDQLHSSAMPLGLVVPRSLDNKPYPVVQQYIGTQMASSASLSTFQAWSFAVSSLDQVSSLTAVFDQYRIVKVEWQTFPQVNSQTSTSGTMGLLASVTDFDDSAALTTFPQALDYQNVMVGSGTDGHYRTFKPHAAIAAYSGSFTSYSNVESPWIDAASTGVLHYGVKTAWQTTSTAYYQDVYIRLHTEWRNVR